MNMVKIKKTAAILLASVMIAGCVTACNEPVVPPAPASSMVNVSQTTTPATSEETPSETTSNITIDQILDSTVKKPSQYTLELNERALDTVRFEDDDESAYANAGFVAGPDLLEIKDSKGNVVWADKYEPVTNPDEFPDTANPILWRNYTLNTRAGLYKVSDKIYQVRGYDITNMTIIEGTTGYIVIDPLLSTECSEAALKLVRDNLGNKPVTAVIITSTDIDRFGGIKGIIAENTLAKRSTAIADQIKSKRPVIIAPKGFSENAVSDGIFASHIKGRIRNYMTGKLLKSIGSEGNLGIGIGLGYSDGTISYIAPTYEVQASDEVIKVDGIAFTFQLLSDYDASYIAMNVHFVAPAIINRGFLYMAYGCSGSIGELYATDNAKLMDGIDMAGVITNAYSRFIDQTNIILEPHNWPHAEPDMYLLNCASAYKFINDQTLLYLNQGYTEDEIINKITLPERLSNQWYVRQTYVPVSSLVRAVCAKYVGTTRSNPVYLGVIEPTEYAQKIVSYMGTPDIVVAKAIKDYENGEYQWVAELMALVIYSNPSHIQAKYLCADALEQLAYQAESGAMRNAYLSAVYELRNGTASTNAISTLTGADTLLSMTADKLLNYMSMLIDASARETDNISFLLDITDTKEKYSVYLKNGALLYSKIIDPSLYNTIKCNKAGLISILQKNDAAIKENVEIIGDETMIDRLTSYMISLPSTFNVIEP